MLYLRISPLDNDFQIEAIAALDQRNDRADVMSKGRAMRPGASALIIAPPMLALTGSGHA